MGRMVRCCLQSLLKLVNSVIGMVGIAMILYSLWMIRVFMGGGDDVDIHTTTPWFIYTFLGLGVFVCFLTCAGHIAAETANGHCLSCYMVLVFLLLVLEAAVTVDVFLNKNWEEDFPDDPTGKFDEFKKFVRSNFKICKWIGLSIVGAQALSIFISMTLRALGPERGSYYDSDDDSAPTRLPLLRNQHQNSPYAVTDPRMFMKNDTWNLNINDKRQVT